MDSNAFLISSSAFGTELATSLSALFASVGGLFILLLEARRLVGLQPLLLGGLIGILGDLPLGFGGLFQLLGGSGQTVNLVFQFLPLGILGGLRAAWSRWPVGISRPRGPPP